MFSLFKNISNAIGLKSHSCDVVFENFCYSDIHNRFLCGSSALRKARGISRIQLYISMNMNKNYDSAGDELAADIQRYERAKHVIMSKKTLTTLDLLHAHKELFPNARNGGQIRKNTVRISHPTKPPYVPPAPRKLKYLMDSFLDSLNNGTFATPEHVISLYCRFLLIHPFRDGNGRMSRLLVEYMQKHTDYKIHFSLYRLNTENAEYQDALLAFDVKKKLDIDQPYWRTMLCWVENYQNQADFLLDELKLKLQSKLKSTPLTDVDACILKLLLKQPIVSKPYINRMLDVDHQKIAASMSKLAAVGVLKLYKTRYTDSDELMLCRDICQFIVKLDELVFSGK